MQYDLIRMLKMKIAICDNDEIITRRTVSLLEDYMEAKRINLKYEIFASYESVQDKIDDFDLFILDYNMNEDDIAPDGTDLMNGMDFARLIRSKSDPHKGIIFLTSYNEIVYESFEVRAYNFLVKPLQKEKLFNVIDSYMNTTVETGKIMVKYKNDTHIISIDEIYYFEVVIKEIFIHLESKTIKCRKKIETFEEDLTSFGFFRTHRSYLVNISKIDTINSKSAVMKNGDKICVSGKKYAELCEKFLDNN